MIPDSEKLNNWLTDKVTIEKYVLKYANKQIPENSDCNTNSYHFTSPCLRGLG